MEQFKKIKVRPKIQEVLRDELRSHQCVCDNEKNKVWFHIYSINGEALPDVFCARCWGDLKKLSMKAERNIMYDANERRAVMSGIATQEYLNAFYFSVIILSRSYRQRIIKGSLLRGKMIEKWIESFHIRRQMSVR